jgi:hypothetical protein
MPGCCLRHGPPLRAYPQQLDFQRASVVQRHLKGRVWRGDHHRGAHDQIDLGLGGSEVGGVAARIGAEHAHNQAGGDRDSQDGPLPPSRPTDAFGGFVVASGRLVDV